MFTFILDNMATIIVSLVLAGVAALIISKMVKNKKEGKSSCSCGSCGSCAAGCSCHSAASKHTSEPSDC